MNALHPNSFWIPDEGVRKNLNAGDVVKLVFERPKEETGIDSERMWVRVSERCSDGSYRGTLDNDPVFIRAKAGEFVEFEARHVINVFY